MKFNNLIYILLALLCPTLSIADNYVIINQVLYDTSLGEGGGVQYGGNGEFVELYNAGTNDVNLEGWQLKGGSPSEVWTFTAADNIPSQGFLLVACRRGATNNFQLTDWYAGAVGRTVIYQNKIMLNNDGETITLCNAINDTIDQIYYDGDSHKTNPDRLYAENENNLAGDSCVSLHRTWVEFDADGKVVPGTSQWQTTTVSFSENMLPHDSYQEDYLLGEQSLPTGENYILSVVPLDPTTRVDINNGHVSLSSGVRYKATLTYLDGIGREEQIIALNASPEKQDIVSSIEYIGKYKVAKQWLPIALDTEGQRTPLSELTAQVQSEYADNRPFTETLYESSALRRITKRYLPGETYYEPHGAAKSYSFNDSEETVRLYTVIRDSVLNTTGESYPAHSLYKTTTTDEDGRNMIVYTDQLGQTILEKRADNCTYYVYDKLRRLRYVLTHSAQAKLTEGEYTPDNATLRAEAYYYRYDAAGNMIYKRLPGCEPQYMVYDKTGQLVLKQDGNQRLANKWIMCTYDSIGRNISMKEIETSDSHESMIGFFANQWHVSEYGSEVRLLTVNYYDNYDYLSTLQTAQRDSLQFVQETGFGKRYDNTIGLLTGTCIYDLWSAGVTTTAYYYDVHGRVVQSRSALNTGGYAITSTEYLFDGSVAQQQTMQNTSNDLIQEHYRYTYDHVGRPLKTFYRLNNDAEITLSSFSYDSIGRLVQNLLHNSADGVRYSYDMRNMLTESQNTHFSERLYYADNLPEGVSSCYNGNISASHIANADTIFTFAYTYDQQNRLTASNVLTDYAPSFCESYVYDQLGNISSFKRYSGNRLIDSLDYYYGNDGNQLLSITDNGQDADDYDVVEYHSANIQSDTTMFYDANGNLIRDLDRGITAIKYNILNLPDTIQFINGNQIVNLYDASGHKYKSIAYTIIPTIVTAHYEVEHYTFDTDTVEYLVKEYTCNTELCYTRTDTLSQRIFNSIGYYSDSTYYHYIKDHLGNICAVVNSAADTVVQSTLYYASGVPMAQSRGRETQPYLYNGKEFIEAHGWNTYDYGFRGYYAPIARFTSIDPLAEQTPWQSPYAYAGNNFINAIDWMGLGAYTTSDPDRIADLLSFLSGGGSVNDYNTTGWLDITDEIERLSEEYGLGAIIGTNLTYAYSGGGGSLYGAKIVAEVYNYAPRLHYDEISSEISKIAQNALNIGTFGTTAWSASQWNPYYWIGANGQLYTREFLHKRGGYAYSFKKAGERMLNSGWSKLGTKLGYISIGVSVVDMIVNGPSVKSGIDIGIAGLGIIATSIAAPELILFCTIYGFTDIGVTWATGNSISGWIDYGVHQGINYFTEE